MQTQEILSKMLAITETKDWEYGFALDDFYQLVNLLPMAQDYGRVLEEIDQLQTIEEMREYFKDVAFVRLAESPNLTETHLNMLFERGRWAEMNELAENEYIDGVFRKKAEEEADRLCKQSNND